MKRLLREPLLHFLLIGAGLFLAYGAANPTDPEVSESRIVVDAGRIAQLSTIFQKTWLRPPTVEELQGLVDDFVLEEVYYREALEMGLDRDDTIIRRRLRQKLEFFTDDTTALLEPTEADLKAYLAEHEDRFRAPPTYTFRQLYFNPEAHGSDPEAFVAEQLEDLRSGRPASGDVSLLPESFDRTSSRSVDGTFGRGFSEALDRLPVGRWQGPVRSGLGLHLIRLETRSEGRLPALEEIRPEVEREWVEDRRVRNRRRLNDRLLEDYEVIVEWPDPTPPRAEPGEGGAS